MNLRWTDAGRAALADAANTGTAALRLTHFAIGDMHGPGGAADDGRAALRGERHRAAVTGTAAADDRIAFRADFTPDASYSITEAGVFGTAGDPAGPLTLYLHWTDGGTAAGQAADGTALAIAAVIEFQAAAADVAVTVGGTIEFGQPPGEASEAQFGLTRYASAAENDAGQSGERAVTPRGMRQAAGRTAGSLVAGGPDDGTVYQFQGAADGRLVVVERTQDGETAQAVQAANTAIAANATAITGAGASIAAILVTLDPLPGEVAAVEGRVSTVEGKTRDATTGRKGIVELVTSAEGQAGTDEVRAMTAKAVRDAASETVASLKAVAPTAGEKLILEGVAGGGVRVIPNPFELYFEAAGFHAPGGNHAPGNWPDISINGQSSWSIDADGTYLLVFAAAQSQASYVGVRFFRTPEGGARAALPSQFLSGEDYSTLLGCIWCGDLDAGDSIDLDAVEIGDNFAYFAADISKLTLVIARIN